MNDITFALPCPRLDQTEENSEIYTCIDQLSTYVAKNGEEFENKTKVKEKDNPKFNFLFETNSFEYNHYKWRVLCCKLNLNDEQEREIIKLFVSKLLSYPAGTIDLIESDKQYFCDLLLNNTGTKDKIKVLRKWTLERSHSMASIASVIANFIENQKQSQNSFKSILHTIYVINDILFNGNSATAYGIYLNCVDSIQNDRKAEYPSVNVFNFFFPFIGNMLHIGYHVTVDESERSKLFRIIELWRSKEFINDFQKSNMETQMLSSVVLPPVVSVHIVSPIEQIQSIITKHMEMQLESQSKQQQIANFLHQQQISQQNQQMPPPSFPLPSTALPQQQIPPSQHPHSMSDANNNPIGISSLPVLPTLGMPSLYFKPDMTNIPVGIMANIAKNALAAGQPKYTPVDLNLFFSTAKHIEPGRLDVRVNEFYQKVQESLMDLE